MDNTKIKKLVMGIVGVILLLILWPVSCVSEGNRGLRFTFGKISDSVITPGMTVYLPIFQKIQHIPITPIVIEKNIEVGSGGCITKDNQTVGADIKVFYKYQQDKLVMMWSKYGTDRVGELVSAAITESFKVVIGSYDIFAIPQNQDEIRQKVLTTIRAKMTEYPVEITDLNVLNYDWSDEFDKQIQETMNRAQQVKQKEQELLITQQEAQKKVKEAEADKQALVTRAEGEREAAKLNAEAKAMEGEGIRKYNQSVQANMELEVQLRKLEIEKIKAGKWNGQYVPNNCYGPIPVDTKGGVKE